MEYKRNKKWCHKNIDLFDVFKKISCINTANKNMRKFAAPIRKILKPFRYLITNII